MNTKTTNHPRRLRLWALFALCIVVCAAGTSVAGQQFTKDLAPGVTLMQEISTEPVPLIVTAAVVDLANPSVSIKAAIGQDAVMTNDPLKGREKISSLTGRKGALIGINADFFPFGDVPTGDPLNACVIDGELVSEPSANRAVIGITADNKAFFDNPRLDATLSLVGVAGRQIDGINRIRETNQVVVYTAAFGPSTQSKYKATDIVCTSQDLPIKAGKPAKLTVTDVKLDAINTPIPKDGVVVSGGGPAAFFLKENAKPGDVITVTFNIKSASDYDWTQVAQAVGGGPRLLKDGKVFVDNDEEDFGASFCTTKHPRSAAGITADGKLMLVTVDGRQSISQGIALTDLAALMARLGCVNAINLDGGGSSTLAVRGLITNSVSGTDERAVADGLLVFAPQPQCAELPKLAIAGLTGDAVSGQGVQLQLVSGDDAKPLTEDQLKGVVWGSSGAGFVNQAGYYSPIKARKGKLKAMLGSQIVETDVTIVAGPPAKVVAALTADKTDPQLSTLKVSAVDANSNACIGKDVILSITGGKPDPETGVTDDKGTFTTTITWDPAATDRRATAVVGDASGEAVAPSPAPASPTGQEPVKQ